MTGLPGGDRAAAEALVVDRYLEHLLAAADRGADDAPATARLDPAVRDAARTLRRSLVRVHPSFRFEDRLASRLEDLARAMRREAGLAGGAVVGLDPVALPSRVDDPLLAAIAVGELDPADEAAVAAESRLAAARRPLIVGGAITSAALSLAGVAWFAWRAARPAGRGAAASQAARPADAHGAARLAGELLSGTGIGGPA